MKFDPSVFKEKNLRDYKDSYDAMHWLTREEAVGAGKRRSQILDSIFGGDKPRALWRFAQTKPYTGELSPGCRLCGEGAWSCLFINNLCNAACFYCPSPQKDRSIPGTGNLEFKTPEAYGDYVDIFGIKGVSFSGGEPTLSFDRVVHFLKTLRKRKKDSLYIWMYTNGILITEDKLKTLRDHGLDELRFDIGAVRYDLEKVRMAVGIIPRVTVEIPAIPGDVDILKHVVKDLYNMGVNFLNLHQLRCTNFNKEKFIQKNYTFLHGPGVAILETELAALEIIKYTLDHNIELPVNYCSFIYRHQFQGAGGRRRNALIAKKGYEDVTQTGYIRSMSLVGTKALVDQINDRLISSGCDPGLWQVSQNRERLLFSSSVWDRLDFSGFTLAIKYFDTSLRQSLSYRYPFQEVKLNARQKVIIERRVEPGEIFLKDDIIGQFFDCFICENPLGDSFLGDSASKGPLAEVVAYERFRNGLMDYF